VLEDASRRITRYLRRRGLFGNDSEENRGALTAPEGDEPLALAELAATSASGMTPPAGPSWRRAPCLRTPTSGTSTGTCRWGEEASRCPPSGITKRVPPRRVRALWTSGAGRLSASTCSALRSSASCRTSRAHRAKKELSDGTIAVELDPLRQRREPTMSLQVLGPSSCGRSRWMFCAAHDRPTACALAYAGHHLGPGRRRPRRDPLRRGAAVHFFRQCVFGCRSAAHRWSWDPADGLDRRGAEDEDGRKRSGLRRRPRRCWIRASRA
jgi:hypothetical protein